MKKFFYSLIFSLFLLSNFGFATNHVALMDQKVIREAEDTKLYSMYTKEDMEIMCKIVHAEARGEGQKGQMAVANVVLNRVNSDYFPDSIKEVVYQSGQFSPVASKDFSNIEPSSQVRSSVRSVLLGKRVVDDSVLYFKSTSSPATWGRLKFLTQIGHHMFYSR